MSAALNNTFNLTASLYDYITRATVLHKLKIGTFSFSILKRCPFLTKADRYENIL